MGNYFTELGEAIFSSFFVESAENYFFLKKYLAELLLHELAAFNRESALEALPNTS
jgi:hypothetical protein